MTPINLEDVESYLVEQIEKQQYPYQGDHLKRWIRSRFAELRAREEAKKHPIFRDTEQAKARDAAPIIIPKPKGPPIPRIQGGEKHAG